MRRADALSSQHAFGRPCAQTAPVNQPTWTGRSGGGGAPRFGASANQRLARAASAEAPASEAAAPAAAGGQAAAAAGGGLGRFGGGLAGTTGGAAPRSSVLLARLRERQAAVDAAASSAARNDPEVRACHCAAIFQCYTGVLHIGVLQHL